MDELQQTRMGDAPDAGEESIGLPESGPEKFGDPTVHAISKSTKAEALSMFENSESKFDKRFNKSISTVESQGTGPISKIDISPEEGNPKATVFLAPGWLEPLATNKYLIRSLVEFGYRVISLEHPRKNGTEKDAGKRHLEAISAVIDSVDLKGEKMFGMGSSLGAIDSTQYADPERATKNHEKFKDFILLNPAGLNTSNDSTPKGVIHLLKKYVAGHMRQGKEAQRIMQGLDETETVAQQNRESGIPLTAVAELIREKMNIPGNEDLKANPMLTIREAMRVGGTRVQEELRRFRQTGHRVFIFTSDQDTLMPGKEFDIKVAGESGLGPEGDKIEYRASDAQVDQVFKLAGYHNTFRNATRLDFDNDQWMSMVWINALLEDLIKQH